MAPQFTRIHAIKYSMQHPSRQLTLKLLLQKKDKNI